MPTPQPSVSPAPTTTLAPTVPYKYQATSNIACSSYINMDRGWWGGEVLIGGHVTLEQCAAAAWAMRGVETSQGTCVGDYFYFEDDGYCNCPTNECTYGYENEDAGGPGTLYTFGEYSDYCDESTWVDIDNNVQCGDCYVLADNMGTYETCTNYCRAQGERALAVAPSPAVAPRRACRARARRYLSRALRLPCARSWLRQRVGGERRQLHAGMAGELRLQFRGRWNVRRALPVRVG